ETASLSIFATRLPGFLQQLMPDEQGGAQGPSGVSRRRLNPNTIEGPFAEETAISHAIECHAARQYEALQSGFSVQVPADAQYHLLGHCLDAGRQVHVPLLEIGFRAARRTAE